MKNKGFKSTLLLIILTLTMLFSVACAKDEPKASEPATTPVAEAPVVAEVAAVKAMTGDELVAQNAPKEKDKVLIIDVRSPEEYKAGHVPNAININIEGFEDRIGEIEDHKEKPVIVYCNSGKKSGEVATILVNNGFKDVTNADGVKQYEYDLVHYEDIRGAEFEKFINQNKDIVLVDVRPAKQVAEEGMIAGSINVPFDAVEANIEKLPKDKTIALYCNTGTKSAEVAIQLEGLGYENVINAIEGVKEYAFTLVK